MKTMQVQAIAAAAMFAVGFGSGNWLAGKSWGKRYSDLQLSYEQARAEGEAMARDALQSAYERDLAARLKSEQQAKEALQRVTVHAGELEALTDELEQKYREAIRSPGCAEWDAAAIACPVGVLGPIEATGAGSDRSAGPSPMEDRAGRASADEWLTTFDPANQRRDAGAVAGIAARSDSVRRAVN